MILLGGKTILNLYFFLRGLGEGGGGGGGDLHCMNTRFDPCEDLGIAHN